MKRMNASQQGLAVVELAILLPLILLLLLGTAEMARAMYEFNALTKSVRDGARHLSDKALLGSSGSISVAATDAATVKSLIVYGSTAGSTPLLPGLSPADVTITVLDNRYVRVSAQYDYLPQFLVIPGFDLASDVRTTTAMTAAVTVRAL